MLKAGAAEQALFHYILWLLLPRLPITGLHLSADDSKRGPDFQGVLPHCFLPQELCAALTGPGSRVPSNHVCLQTDVSNFPNCHQQ